MKKIATKVFLASLASGVLVGLVSLSGMLFSFNTVNSYSIEAIQATMFQDYDNTIKSEIDTVYSLIDWYYQQSQKGRFTGEEAKKQAADLVRELRYGNNAYFWIDTSKGDNIVLLGGKSEGTNRFELKDANGKLLVQEIIQAALAGGGFTDYYFPRAGETEPLPKRGYSRYFEPFDWVIGTGNYVDDMNAVIVTKKNIIQKMILKAMVLMFLVISAGIIVTVVISFLIGRAIAKPITHVSLVLKELAEGDADLTNRLPILSKDEVGQLSENYNVFLEKLSAIVKAINESMKKTIELKETMSNGSQETLSALNEISANAASMNTRLQYLDKNIEDANGAVRSIESSIDSVDNGIESQVSAVEQATASVNEMVASLKNVSDVTDKKGRATQALVDISGIGKQNMDTTRSIIGKISQNIGSINEMVSMINSIASQTNLLAMNAAIEAAHAGESGKGFAVVASEIRKLAETSSKNAKDIGINLKQILVFIAEADTSSEKGMKVIEQVNSEVKETARSLDEILSNTRELFIGGEQILEAMTSLTQVSLQVKENSGRMKGGSRIMNSTITAVSSISGEVVTGMNEIAIGTHEITENMSSINRQMVILSEVTDSLKAEVGRFKV